MNTIRAVLDTFQKKDCDGYYARITIFTRSGNEFTGTLADWDPSKAPNLVKITDDSNGVTFVTLADIEAVSTERTR